MVGVSFCDSNVPLRHDGKVNLSVGNLRERHRSGSTSWTWDGAREDGDHRCQGAGPGETGSNRGPGTSGLCRAPPSNRSSP